MTMEIQVRKARLQDAESIANFVNRAHGEDIINRLDVAQRFSQVGFMLAEQEDTLVGVMGWQVENLVIRVIDFLIAPMVNPITVGEILIEAVEEAGKELEAEASILFLPPEPSETLTSFWEYFGYEYRPVSELSKAWREATTEWNIDESRAMLKQLRDRMVRRPM